MKRSLLKCFEILEDILTDMYECNELMVGFTSNELCTNHDISHKTLLRHIKHMRELGVDIKAVRRRRNGYTARIWEIRNHHKLNHQLIRNWLEIEREIELTKNLTQEIH